MVDLRHLNDTIASAERQAGVAAVTTDWLKEVERDLAELEQRRAKDQKQ